LTVVANVFRASDAAAEQHAAPRKANIRPIASQQPHIRSVQPVRSSATETRAMASIRPMSASVISSVSSVSTPMGMATVMPTTAAVTDSKQKSSAMCIYLMIVFRNIQLTAFFPGQYGLASTRKIKLFWILMKQEVKGFFGWQRHQPDRMQTVFTSLQTDKHQMHCAVLAVPLMAEKNSTFVHCRIHIGFCAPDLGDFQELFALSDEQLFKKYRNLSRSYLMGTFTVQNYCLRNRPPNRQLPVCLTDCIVEMLYHCAY